MDCSGYHVLEIFKHWGYISFKKMINTFDEGKTNTVNNLYSYTTLSQQFIQSPLWFGKIWPAQSFHLTVNFISFRINRDIDGEAELLA